MTIPTLRRLSCLAPILFATACGGGAPAPESPRASAPAASATSPNAAPPPPTLAAFDVDPVLAGLGRNTPGPGTAADAEAARLGIDRLCEDSLARARATLDEIRALDGAPSAALTWDSTVGKLDRARLAISSAGQFPALMAVSHPDDGVREKAKLCEPRIDKLDTALWLDAKLAGVMKRYAAKKEALSPVRARLLAHTLRDFRRSGLDLDPKGRARITEINAELTKLGLDFDTNLAESHLTVLATPAQLEGLPKEWIASHPPNKDGKIEITTDYPDYYPVLQYAKDRKLALELYKQFENRAADKNLAVIDEMLALRAEKAKLLGYATWADYVLEPRMAKDAKTVAGFLESLRKHLAKKGDAELAEFKAARAKLGGKPTDPMLPSDRLYLEDQVRKAKYGLDSKEVSKYFEVRRVKEGLLAITSKLFDIRFRPAPDAPTWHADVEPMEVTDADGKLLGRFYFDLYPRDNKYKHAAVFSIRDTTKMPGTDSRAETESIVVFGGVVKRPTGRSEKAGASPPRASPVDASAPATTPSETSKRIEVVVIVQPFVFEPIRASPGTTRAPRDRRSTGASCCPSFRRSS